MFEKPRLEAFSYFLAPSIDNSQARRVLAARDWIICSIFLRKISRHLLFAAGTSRRNSPFLVASPSLALLSFSVLVVDSIRRPYTPMRKDVPRMYVDYYGPSRFYSPSGWRAYHRHLVSRD